MIVTVIVIIRIATVIVKVIIEVINNNQDNYAEIVHANDNIVWMIN